MTNEYLAWRLRSRWGGADAIQDGSPGDRARLLHLRCGGGEAPRRRRTAGAVDRGAGKRLSEVMHTKLKTARAETGQDTVAALISKYNCSPCRSSTRRIASSAWSRRRRRRPLLPPASRKKRRKCSAASRPRRSRFRQSPSVPGSPGKTVATTRRTVRTIMTTVVVHAIPLNAFELTYSPSTPCR